MRDVSRRSIHGIRLAFLIVLIALTGCTKKQSAEENGSTRTDGSAVQDFSKKEEEELTETESPLTESQYETDASDLDEINPMGWYVPKPGDLKETTWTTYQDPEEGERTNYVLTLYGGEQAGYGEYDGEVCFAWLYEDEEEYQEYYEGWWSLKEVDEQVCLCLDICRMGGSRYHEGKEPKVISNQFPVLWNEGERSMILHRGLQAGRTLPFLEGETTFEFLTQETEYQSEGKNCVHVQWAEDALPDLSDYERFRLGLDEEQPLLYFWTEQTITDFKELSITFESIDDDGNIQFSVEETYNHGTLTPETPLFTRMELIGAIPNNGISYVDGSGNTRYFAVEVSGYDGSLLLTEFIP